MTSMFGSGKKITEKLNYMQLESHYEWACCPSSRLAVEQLVAHLCRRREEALDSDSTRCVTRRATPRENPHLLTTQQGLTAPSLQTTTANFCAYGFPWKTGRNSPARYFTSRISFSFTAQRSSIFLVSECVSFSSSSRVRFCSSWLIFFSFSSLSTASLMSRRILRTAVR